ncbi:helix-turn-helix transcriptional regulator [Neobacillus drentensis]|uniref:helix-turn-helix domain-containing protein n=1 Tax=Neobacillus drentensis TaxID=220684 RepID=UPI002FFFA4A3
MIGERIRELRKRKNMTLRELASELGIPFTTLGNYERGDRSPDFGLVLEIAKYFGVSMDYLTRGDDIVNFDEYQVIRYTEDFNQMLSKAEPSVREQILKIHDILFFLTCDHAIGKQENKELDHLQKIFNSILKAKNGFGMGIKKGGLSPSEKYELLKLALKEKEEIDRSLNELFEIYIEK